MLNIDKYVSILKNKRIIAGISGGPDSMCLLDLLIKKNSRLNLKISVCHVNYSLRGLDSQKDEELVKKVCEKSDIKCFILNYKKEFNKISEDENALREVRYDFFRKTKEKAGADLIVLAHNSDDQAETILLNFLRGGSLKGLSGMDFLQKDIIRPLLEFSRDEIMEYIKENKIEYRIDKSNLSRKYTRNKIRLDLMPFLKKEFNPNIKETIIRNSGIIKNINYFLKDYSNIILNNISRELKNGIEIDYKKWLLLPEALKYETIKMAIDQIIGSLIDIDFNFLSETVEMLTNKISFGKKEFNKKLIILEKNDKIAIVKL